MEPGKQCTARQVSNAGIVLSCGQESIGIDIFSRDVTGMYPDTPKILYDGLMQEIREGQLKTLLITHEHPDHFDPDAVLEAWRYNRSLQILSTESVVRLLMRRGIPLTSLHIAEEKETQFGIFSVTPLQSVHEGKTFESIQHLIFLLKIGGCRVVVSGDAKPLPHLFGRLQKWSRRIDWFFLPFPYVGRPAVRRMMESKLDIAHIWVVHCPNTSKDQYNWIEKAKKICREADDALPEPFFGWPDGKRFLLGNRPVRTMDKWRYE